MRRLKFYLERLGANGKHFLIEFDLLPNGSLCDSMEFDLVRINFLPPIHFDLNPLFTNAQA